MFQVKNLNRSCSQKYLKKYSKIVTIVAGLRESLKIMLICLEQHYEVAINTFYGLLRLHQY